MATTMFIHARPTFLSLALLLCVLSAPAMADDGGLYVSANLGTTLSTYSRSDLNSELNNAFTDELTFKTSTIDKPKAPWWVDVGYMASPYFGVAASYLDLQTLKYQATATSLGNTPVDAHLHIISHGPTLALLGALPLWNAWRLTGQAGVYLGRTTTNYASDVGTMSNSGSESTTAASLLLGVGGAYTFARHCAVRLDYLYIDGVHEKVLGKSFNESVLTAGFVYAF
jgi:opacity protein-like surface antigen